MPRFELVKSETVPLTKALADQIANMPGSPTERDLNPSRLQFLAEKADPADPLLVPFCWAIAEVEDEDGKQYRVNGQHSSKMLADLNGGFPDSGSVHLDTFRVKDRDHLADLFRQCDTPKSARTSVDVANAYKGLEPTIASLETKYVQAAVKGISFWTKNVVGSNHLSGDDIYQMLHDARYHPFIQFFCSISSSKTREMQRPAIVAAMVAAHDANQAEAELFLAEVARGGTYGPGDPSTALSVWLTSIQDAPKGSALSKTKPTALYNGVVFCWNAYRASKQVINVRASDKRGYLDVSA